MATNTKLNIGIRRMICSLDPPQYRNFEPSGTVQYSCNRQPPAVPG